MSQSLKRIPVPFSQRLHDFRLRGIPLFVFAGAIVGAVALWKQAVVVPTLVGQAEPVVANISSYKAGVLAECNVIRFQKVRAGDPVGQVMVTDPRILASTLAVIQSEIELIRVNMRPVVSQQHAAMDYDHLRLVWMRQRADLATAKVNLQAAEAEHHRMEELFHDKIVSQRSFEQAQAARDRLQSEIAELSAMVAEGETNFSNLQTTNVTDLSKVSNSPLLAAIAVQEAKLRQTESELNPIILKAPMDGIINAIFCRSGEAVTAGQVIASIATLNPVRIVGYLRAPVLEEPKVGMRVEVRTRGLKREIGSAKIMEVGGQLENIPAIVSGPFKLTTAELGLPLDISLPNGMKIRPGELVDIRLVPEGGGTGL
ncbi:MAG TPA: HlyD family efflux transporter periplasmic adaptor subunit [Candidatus Dormibacteraeota bacterium]|nr:HlyD family efflux transporter periplasmic adaptor subunit [Candidatus Dormibacteraeota bacterium]